MVGLVPICGRETLRLHQALAKVVHRRGTKVTVRYARNLITKAQVDFLFTQVYIAGSGNGLNYIALSADPLTETPASTALSSELSGGLGRAQGTVTHVSGTSLVSISNTFTATEAANVQKLALFTAPTDGTMGHPLAFDPVPVLPTDTVTVTITITIG